MKKLTSFFLLLAPLWLPAQSVKISTLTPTNSVQSNTLFMVSSKVGSGYATRSLPFGVISNNLAAALASVATNASVGAVNTASNNILTAAQLAATNAAGAVVTNQSLFAVTNASRTPLIRAHPWVRLPINTLNKLNQGQGISVLWIGDSLAYPAVSTHNLSTSYFLTNMLANWGTNGNWGGILFQNPGGLNLVSYAGTTNFVNAGSDSSMIFIDQSAVVLSNTFSVELTKYGGGFVTSDSAALTYGTTNSDLWGILPAGTLNVYTVKDDGTTNQIAALNCSDTVRQGITTNWTFTAGNYKLMLSSSGGATFFASPGLWSSTGTGVRYGIMGSGGLNNFVQQIYWVTNFLPFQPDLVLLADANDSSATTLFTLVQQLQTYAPNPWTNTDFVFVGVPPNSVDYQAQDGEGNSSDWSWAQQLFARTNRNTGFFDSKFYLGDGFSFQTMTNLAILSDLIHPGTGAGGLVIGNNLGRRLVEDLQLDKPASGGATATTNLLVTTNTWTGDNNFAGLGQLNLNANVGVVVGGSSGLTITGQTATVGLHMKSRTAADALYYRIYPETNGWHFTKSADEGKDIFFLKYTGNSIEMSSDGPYFNYDNTFAHQPAIGRTDRPYMFWGSFVAKSNDWTRPPLSLAEGDCFFTSSNGTPTVIRKLGGVLLTNNLVTPP